MTKWFIRPCCVCCSAPVALLQVARIFRNPLVACVSVAQLTPVCDKLAQVWDSNARQLSRERQAARLAGEQSVKGHRGSPTL